MKTGLDMGEALAAAVQKTPNRVTLEDMKGKIVGAEYYRSTLAPHLTICILLLVNGFTLVGKSAPADPSNFDQEAGEKFAYEDALRQLWPLEGYLLRERLHQEGAPDRRSVEMTNFWQEVRGALTAMHVGAFTHNGPDVVRMAVAKSPDAQRLGITDSETAAFIKEFFR